MSSGGVVRYLYRKDTNSITVWGETKRVSDQTHDRIIGVIQRPSHLPVETHRATGGEDPSAVFKQFREQVSFLALDVRWFDDDLVLTDDGEEHIHP